MNFKEVTAWVEAHPTESIVIGAGGVLVVLWLLGAFSGSPAASNSGASNLASAYYAAEAQQAVVGGQIQMATIQSAAATAQNAAQVNGAVAVAKSQSKAAVTINGQNASAATTINGQDDTAATVNSNNQLLATYSNNATTVATTNSNNYFANKTAEAGFNAGELNNMISSVLAPEIAKYGSGATQFTDTSGAYHYLGAAPSGDYSINALLGLGYTLPQAQKKAGVA
jgi:hypothetical protein